MGVNGFWEIVEPAAQRTSLKKLAVENGLEGEHALRGYRVGIDASVWMKQAQQPFLFGHAQSGMNPELKVVFHRLARLARLPIFAIIVFDGPGRPNVKRGKKVIKTDHFLTEHIKKLVEAFGFASHTAPGEAEAELALMNQQGILDAVLTDDSDALVFGAEVVIRNPTVKVDGDNVDVYTRHAIERTTSTGLSRGGMLLIAILSGGDYEAGLVGCGSHIAHGLAHCGLGVSLYHAVLELDRESLQRFLDRWRDDLRSHLYNNHLLHLARRHPALASSIPSTFPNIDILAAYVRPLTSALPFNLTYSFATQAPHINVPRLAQLCQIYFSWGTPVGILQKFQSMIWPGVLLRLLISEALQCGAGMNFSEQQPVYEIQDHADGNDIAEHWVSFYPRIYAMQVSQSLLLSSQTDNAPHASIAASFRFKIPFALLSRLPHGIHNKSPSLITTSSILYVNNERSLPVMPPTCVVDSTLPRIDPLGSSGFSTASSSTSCSANMTNSTRSLLPSSSSHLNNAGSPSAEGGMGSGTRNIHDAISGHIIDLTAVSQTASRSSSIIDLTSSPSQATSCTSAVIDLTLAPNSGSNFDPMGHSDSLDHSSSAVDLTMSSRVPSRSPSIIDLTISSRAPSRSPSVVTDDGPANITCLDLTLPWRVPSHSIDVIDLTGSSRIGSPSLSY